jgi:hypothetical protein
VGNTTGSAAAVSGLLAGPGRPLALATLVSWLVTASIGGYMLTGWIRRGGVRRPAGAGLPPAVVFTHVGLALTGLVVWGCFLASWWVALAWSAVAVLTLVIGLGLCVVTLLTPYPVYPAAVGTAPPGRPGTHHRNGRTGGPVTGPAGGMLAAHAEDVLARRLTDDVLARALTDDALAGRLADDVLASLPQGPSHGGGGRRSRPRQHMAPLIPAAHGMAAITTFLLAVLTAAGAF